VSCLLGLAVAAPQGYNYQAQLQQNIPALQAPAVQPILAGGGLQFSTSSSQQSQVYQQQAPLGGNIAYNVQPQIYQPQPQLQQQHQHHQQPLVSKDIYVHVPPVDVAEEAYPQPALPPPPPRKHYRIVFIKAPTPSVSKAALRVKQAPVEEKTIIYVLTKKPDPLDLQAAIEEAAPKQPSKPEVFFIKYKTQEEAAHAQRTIQAQYDQLGGTSQISDEGVAPVTSVIGVLDNQQQQTQGGGLTRGVPNNYLPALSG
ncbi:hypothetical protein KR054_002851, partial [Drosophila jambulina]